MKNEKRSEYLWQKKIHVFYEIIKEKKYIGVINKQINCKITFEAKPCDLTIEILLTNYSNPLATMQTIVP